MVKLGGRKDILLSGLGVREKSKEDERITW